MGHRKNRYQKTQLDMEMGCQKVAEKVKAEVPYCDVVLKVEDAAFFCSRLILGAWSPYFDKMFTSGSEEATQREVDLRVVSKTGFRAIWEFMHGPEFFMEGEEGTLAILRDARFLGMQHLCEIVTRRLLEVLEVGSAFLVFRTAQELNEKELEDGVLAFMARCFTDIVASPGFLEMTMETLKGLLLRDDLMVVSEEDAFLASKRWIDHDPSRKENWPEILDAVRLPLLPLEFLKRNVMADPVIQGDLRCDRIIDEAKDFHVPELRSFVPVAKTVKRGSANRRSIASATEMKPEMKQESRRSGGGQAFFLSHSNDGRKVIAHTRATSWECLHVVDYPYPQELYFSRCFNAIGMRLYVVGEGELKTMDLDGRGWSTGPAPPANTRHPASASSRTSLYLCTGIAARSASALDLESEKWMQLPDILHPRGNATAALHGPALHLLGGMHNGIAKRSHERLDVRDSRWTELAPLPQERAWSASAFHNDRLHLAGGFSSGQKNELFAYEERTDGWIELPAMNEGRWCHGLVSFDKELYAIGGSGSSSIEAFDGSEWKVVKTLDFTGCERACVWI